MILRGGGSDGTPARQLRVSKGENVMLVTGRSAQGFLVNGGRTGDAYLALAFVTVQAFGGLQCSGDLVWA